MLAFCFSGLLFRFHSLYAVLRFVFAPLGAALYGLRLYSAAPKGAKTKNEERHTRNENKAGNQKSWGPAYRQELAESPGAWYPCEPLRSRISSKEAR